MKIIVKLLTVVFVSIALSACNSNDKDIEGALENKTGDSLKSQFGVDRSQLIDTGVGEVAGALTGDEIETKLDENDKKILLQSSRRSLDFAPSGNRVEWKNSKSGNHGSIIPTKTFKESGRYCREYVQEVVIAGKKQRAYGRACRQPDGSWKIIQ